ncbi:hypothetical protein ABAC460_03590 [Asticcacaulis sp. AC460]|uniref:hypothetical protein n=1 Tax=Asticcacaulis sp. AC460 TaxID=1282360 RepID=UPI0003C3D91A|nr:hypothetical protein [Asticcacaulis sp. AC460]ESQ91992.1 hypothetical protein ABAC460_03590 [Asticcacaulis sp. AC460]
MTRTLLIATASLLALAACSPKTETSTTTTTTTTTSVIAESAATSITSAEASFIESSASLDTFTGKWTGPEGTSLTVTPNGGTYKVTVVNLDGPRDFAGIGVDNGIKFTRDGQAFTIRKGTGDDTGMKWLAGKKDCIVVALGEGYCHD